MDKSPYATEFLLKQFDMVIKNIKKPIYKEEVGRLLNHTGWFEVFKTATDRKSRNYKHGILERTAAVGSLAMCIYDNYPTVDIDLILAGVVVAGFKDCVGKKQVYGSLNSEDLKQIAFKKSRKKPKLEYFIFDELFKLDVKLSLAKKQPKKS